MNIKKSIKNIKVYFMILNIVLALVAFNYIVSAAGGDVAGGSSTPVPGTSGSEGNTNIPGTGPGGGPIPEGPDRKSVV